MDMLRRCLTDPGLPLNARAAGALVLLFGVRLSTVSVLTTDHVTTYGVNTYVALGGTPVLVPPALAELIADLIARPQRFAGTTADIPRYLLPAGGSPAARSNPVPYQGCSPSMASTPAQAAIPTARPRRRPAIPHPGQPGRLSPTIADGWSRLAQADWSAYLSARPKISE